MATPAVVIVVELQTLPAFTASASPVMMSIASWVDAILEADDDPASCEGLAHKLGATGAVPVFAAALTAAFAEARAGCPTGGHLDAAIDVPRPTYLIRFLRKIAGGCPCVAVQVMRATASVADAFYTPHPPPGGGGRGLPGRDLPASGDRSTRSFGCCCGSRPTPFRRSAVSCWRMKRRWVCSRPGGGVAAAAAAAGLQTARPHGGRWWKRRRWR